MRRFVETHVMKSFILLSVLLLSACNSIPIINTSDTVDEDASLSSQYSTDQLSENEASNINTQLGAGYIANGRYDRALAKLEKALAIDSDNALAHNYLGVLYGHLERPELAYQQFKQSMSLSPNNSTLLNNYAIFLCTQEKYDEGIKKFERVVANPLYANRAGAYQSAGDCAFSNNDYLLAEKFYRSAIRTNPETYRSMLGLAKVHYIQQTYPLAWNYFQRFDHLSVQDADSLWLGLNIMKYLNDPDKNLISSFQLQLKSKFPDSDETKWFYQGKQEY